MTHPDEFVFDMYKGNRNGLLAELSSALGGQCDEGCLGRLATMATLHVGRNAKTDHPTPLAYAKMMQRLVAAYDAFVVGVLQPAALPEGTP